jgi:hypothetical protein
MALDPKTLRLGKKAPRVDPKALRAERYLNVESLPAPPEQVDHTKGVTEFGMMLNGPNTFGEGVPEAGIGDCVEACIGHGDQIVTLNSPGGELTPVDELILNLYEETTGYNPADPNTDNGSVIIDVLDWVKQKGLGKKGELHHRRRFPLLGYADVNPNNLKHVMQSIEVFGLLGIGLQLPISAQGQVGGVWDVVGDPKTDANSLPGSWGGHCVGIPKYDATSKILTCITWGTLQEMTLAFFLEYCDEAHALLFEAWLEQTGPKFPEMWNLLQADLKQVAN